MKVLVNTLADANEVFEVECRVCKSVLEIEFSDLTYRPSGYDQRDQTSWKESWSVQCPVCHRAMAVQLNEKQILKYHVWSRNKRAV